MKSELLLDSNLLVDDKPVLLTQILNDKRKYKNVTAVVVSYIKLTEEQQIDLNKVIGDMLTEDLVHQAKQSPGRLHFTVQGIDLYIDEMY